MNVIFALWIGVAGLSPSELPPVEHAHEHPHEHETSVWDLLADCESGGDWDTNTGNGFYGGLQFHDDTWDWLRPSGFPERADLATREQQIAVAERVLEVQGWRAWPACSRKIGLR